MLLILSPAKTLDMETETLASKTSSSPALLTDASVLVKLLRKRTPGDLQVLMGISKKLAKQNHQRFQDWKSSHSKDVSKPAIFAFQGDVYRGLQANKLSAKQIQYAQDHVRILSGLYGVLRPLDPIQAYRLEMGTSLANPRGKNLYEFWDSRITEQLREQLQASGSKMLLNLASNEYFKSIQKETLDDPIVSPAFKQWKNGQFKTISIFAKLARGTMASWVVRNKVKTLRKLTKFSEDGYRFDEEQSSPWVPVFVRGN